MPTQSIDIIGPDGIIDATLHTPSGDGPWPGVIMLTDIRGPRPVFFAQADRLAAEGYAVLLPNPYYREGRAPVPDLSVPMGPDAMPALFKLMGTLTPECVRTDGKAIVDGLLAQSAVSDGPVGVVGYCMGGRFAIYFAEAGDVRVGAAAVYHGSLLINDTSDSPHKAAAGVSATLYFAHADNDEYLPTARLDELETALADAGVDFTSEIYAGAPHGFAVPEGPAHRVDAEDRHWQTLTDLFARKLK